MTRAFEELDHRETVLGELILRRRRPVSRPEQWVYEVKLAGRFLMSSLTTDSERELATRALARVAGKDLRVLVGGLGLGYTAAAALADPRVAAVDVVELLPEVIAWHRNGLVPLGPSLCADPRCRLIEGDCLRRLREAAITAASHGPNTPAAAKAAADARMGASPPPPYDAVLVDIDDSPIHLLTESHADFYTVEGLAAVRASLRPGGVFALWTSLPAEPEVTARLRAAFGNACAEEVRFDNALLDEPEVNAIYFASA